MEDEEEEEQQFYNSMLISHLRMEAQKMADLQVSKSYKTKIVPKAIAENGYNIDPDHFSSYQ